MVPGFRQRRHVAVEQNLAPRPPPMLHYDPISVYRILTQTRWYPAGKRRSHRSVWRCGQRPVRSAARLPQEQLGTVLPNHTPPIVSLAGEASLGMRTALEKPQIAILPLQRLRNIALRATALRAATPCGHSRRG